MGKDKNNKKQSYTPAQIMALKSSVGPKATTALTAKGQKASGLAKPDRSKGPRIQVRGTDQKAFDALNTAGRVAAETVALGAGGGALLRPATKIVAKKVGKSIGGRTAEAAYNANMKGLRSATGAGGKVSRTQTPFGPTLRSTQIGTEAQQAARINNLEVAAFRKATRAGAEASSKAMMDVFKAGKKVRQAGPTLAGGAVTGKNRRKK